MVDRRAWESAAEDRTKDLYGALARLARRIEEREAELPAREIGALAETLLPGEAGRSLEDIADALDEVFALTPSAASPRFVNQLFGGRDPAALLAEMLVPLTNTSMYTFKVAGVQILLERAVLARMASFAGFHEGEGAITPGGSISNLVALLIARNEALPRAREEGLDGRPLAVYTSDQGHYSVRKSAGLLGLGRASVREVPSDCRGRMRPGALHEMIQRDRARGVLPLLVNATAGTTVLGAFDPIEEITGITGQEKLWLHVDGALGGSVLLCRRHRHLLEGVARADSLTWNAHKMMGVPLTCSALLLRRRGLLKRHLSEQADYLFQADGDELNPGTRSIQCGRRNDALKLWAAWLHHGDAGYDARISRLFDLAAYAASRIRADPAMELLAEPESVNVCFRVRGRSSAAICETLDRRSLLKIGHGAALGRRAIRLVCVNPDLSETDLDAALDAIREVAAELPPETGTDG